MSTCVGGGVNNPIYQQEALQRIILTILLWADLLRCAVRLSGLCSVGTQPAWQLAEQWGLCPHPRDEPPERWEAQRWHLHCLKGICLQKRSDTFTSQNLNALPFDLMFFEIRSQRSRSSSSAPDIWARSASHRWRFSSDMNVDKTVHVCEESCILTVTGWNDKCGSWSADPFNDYCYLFNFLSMRTWAEARADCVNQGGDLVSITDPYEQAFVHGKIYIL